MAAPAAAAAASVDAAGRAQRRRGERPLPGPSPANTPPLRILLLFLLDSLFGTIRDAMPCGCRTEIVPLVVLRHPAPSTRIPRRMPPATTYAGDDDTRRSAHTSASRRYDTRVMTHSQHQQLARSATHPGATGEKEPPGRAVHASSHSRGTLNEMHSTHNSLCPPILCSREARRAHLSSALRVSPVSLSLRPSVIRARCPPSGSRAPTNGTKHQSQSTHHRGRCRVRPSAVHPHAFLGAASRSWPASPRARSLVLRPARVPPANAPQNPPSAAGSSSVANDGLRTAPFSSLAPALSKEKNVMYAPKHGRQTQPKLAHFLPRTHPGFTTARARARASSPLTFAVRARARAAALGKRAHNGEQLAPAPRLRAIEAQGSPRPGTPAQGPTNRAYE